MAPFRQPPPMSNIRSPGLNYGVIPKENSVHTRTMNGNTGISADPRRLPQMKLQQACTATQAFERALPEYPFRLPAPYRSCQAETLAGLEAVRQPMNGTMMNMAEVAELASPLRLNRRLRLLHPEADQEAVGSTLPKTPRLRRRQAKLLDLSALPAERPPLHLQTERLRLRDRALSLVTMRRVPLPVVERLDPRLQSTGQRVIRHGWRRCTSRTPVCHRTSRCSPLLPERCSKSNGRKKAVLLPPTTETLPLLPFTQTMHPLSRSRRRSRRQKKNRRKKWRSHRDT